MTDLSGKAAVVTGASRGIGRAVAVRLGQLGASVVVNYSRDASGAAATVAEIEATGSRAISVRADVSKPDEIEALLDTAHSRFDGLDIVVANAGLDEGLGPVLDVTEAEPKARSSRCRRQDAWSTAAARSSTSDPVPHSGHSPASASTPQASCPRASWNARRTAVLSWLGWCAEYGYDGPAVPAWTKRLAVPDSETPARSKMAVDRLIARREAHLREKMLWRIYETAARTEEILGVNTEDLWTSPRAAVP
ncbi:hypothetical protein SUDANB19_00365 [Streptomyces sp. enrichment culture]